MRPFPRIPKKLLGCLLCLIGLTWQVFYISEQYFRYDSVTQVVIKRPTAVKPPALAICIIQERSLGYYNIRETAKATARTIMKATPNVTDMVDKFTINFNAFMQSYPEGNQHQSANYIFKPLIQKFLKQMYLCYAFKVEESITFDYELMTNSLCFPNFYDVIIKTLKFPKSTFFTYFMYPSWQNFHGKSDSFKEQDIIPMIEGSNKFSIDASLSYQEFQSIRLGAPYATNCVDYSLLGFESSYHCRDDCLMNETLEYTSMLHYSIPIYEHLNYTIISYEDIENQTFMSGLRNTMNACQSKCFKKDCTKVEFVPLPISSMASFNNRFALYASTYPIIVSTYKPLITFIDFVTYLLSCLSFWFGFSPFAFFQDRKKKKAVRIGIVKVT